MRPLAVWIAFAACLAVVLAAVGWVSMTVLRLDAASAAAVHQAAVEENVRLALWRMDSALAPLIARESTWPYFAYNPFYPTQRAYTSMFLPIRQGEVLVPSPLLSQPSSDVLLHFLIGPDKMLTSPQVPTDKVRKLAERGFTTPQGIQLATARLNTLRSTVSRDVMLAHLERPEAPPVQITMLPSEGNNGESQQRAQPQNKKLVKPQPNQPAQFDLAQRSERQQQQILTNLASNEPQLAQGPDNQIRSNDQQSQGARNGMEWNARGNNMAWNASVYGNADGQMQQPIGDVHEGMSRPVWLGDTLILARRVLVGKTEYIVGCWLDWPSIERRLLNEIRDLLPQGRLDPIRDGNSDNTGRVLAALPVLLLPGALPTDGRRTPSPLRISLAVAWSCMLLAAAAVAALLAGALSLSERRGAVVSAVTHEMRTPLTTFRMYTEMLVKDMVPPERRVRYLDTLRVEADRLSHLVENVLAYARLERGRSPARTEITTPAEIIDRVRGRLADRAEQAGMKLDVQVAVEPDATLQADPTAVEQILFNLVDNACKYAAAAENRTIHVQASALDGVIAFEVADHGPGVSREGRARLFRPFSKSAKQAAHSAPGVGLGLALSRRLARKMGGDLRLAAGGAAGAAFVLILPRA